MHGVMSSRQSKNTSQRMRHDSFYMRHDSYVWSHVVTAIKKHESANTIEKVCVRIKNSDGCVRSQAMCLSAQLSSSICMRHVFYHIFESCLLAYACVIFSIIYLSHVFYHMHSSCLLSLSAQLQTGSATAADLELETR